MKFNLAAALFITAAATICLAASGSAQVQPAVGIRDNTPNVHAFTNAKIVRQPGKPVEGTLVIRDGIVEAVGAGVSVPADAVVHDMKGMTIYPGLIDAYSSYGLPKAPRRERGGGPAESREREPAGSKGGSRYWNANVRCAEDADALFTPDPKEAAKLREAGFTALHVVPEIGSLRGSTAVFHAGDGKPGELIVARQVAQAGTFQPPRNSDESYPNSLMGGVALIRQALLDARWHKSAMAAAKANPSAPAPEYVSDLGALEKVTDRQMPLLIETSDEHDLVRAAAVGTEFGIPLWVRGSGQEYQRLQDVAATKLPIFLPVNFPDKPAVKTPEEAMDVSMADLRHWDEAPENPKRLHAAGVRFALTAATLKEPGKFLEKVRTAVERGLPADAALAAMTTVPAKLLGVDERLGTLERGKSADLIILDGDLFNSKSKILETWVAGKRYPVKPKPQTDVRGDWQARLSGTPVDTLLLVVKGEADKPAVTVKGAGKEAKASHASFANLILSINFTGDSLGLAGVIRMTGGVVNGGMTGTGELADGAPFRWSAVKSAEFKPEPDTSKPKPIAMASFPPAYPPGSFGRASIPARPSAVFVRGATIWTSGPDGNFVGDMIVQNGRITKLGKGLRAPSGAVVIEGNGKHVTAGLIDAHSHSAAAGSVNESGQAITAEVRIGDVIDPDDISIYRELAGGLTTANVLHGSANPIGGQNQVIKLRWGAGAEAMKFENAKPGIKFALGENPKQSNWGDDNTTRYPQTRSGVEQIIRDEFKAALDYKRSWEGSGGNKIPPRRDLQMETLVEILEKKRVVHSHSYRQDEILMLVRVAEEFGFTIATFQHVLEGYKVAEALAKIGAGASTFSDWWAYKFEVYDAIPYNGTLMHDAGVVVSFNSDSDELARRMNLEAAKAVKYGGTTPEEALKFVTINPAKQLRIDGRVGSLETGKDADFVVWSGSPLSTLSICEQTWIDGRKYFDREEDRAMAEDVKRQRAVLIQKALAASDGGDGGDKKGGGRSRPGEDSMPYSCKEEGR